MATYLTQVKSKLFSQLEQISVVFHQYETGVRSGTIRPGVGMKTLVSEKKSKLTGNIF